MSKTYLWLHNIEKDFYKLVQLLRETFTTTPAQHVTTSDLQVLWGLKHGMDGWLLVTHNIFVMRFSPLWKFQLSSIHFFNFFGLTDTPIARKFQSLLMGEYGYFLELHIICSYCKLIKYLDVKQINISLLCVFENFISCNKSNLFPLLANLNKKNKNHYEWLSDYIFLHCLFWSLIHYT